MKPRTRYLSLTVFLWIIVTMCLGTSYILAQQILRLDANDPQIQLAEDGARALATGTPAEALRGDNPVDLRLTLAPAVLVYNDSGVVLASDAVLDGATPVLPRGVLEYVRLHGQDRITWEPSTGVRLATVVVRSTGQTNGFVAVTRSLREVEIRDSRLLNITFAVWLCATAFVWVAWWIAARHLRHQ